MSSSLLEVDPRVIKALSPSEGVALMRRLLWAEASRLRIPRHKIEISSDITVPDGGIDAKVDAGEQSDSVLVPGPSHYQIKTGLSFKPWQPADVDDELFDGRPVSQDGLGEAVRQCLDGAGVYILVTLGHDLAANKKLNAEKQFQKRFAECGYPGARVMVLGVGQIIGILSLHPSLCLDVMGLGELPFFTIAAWAAMSDMLPSLELGEKQREFIGDLRRAMDSDDIGHIRVVGEPGVGKSRLVLEALRGREDFAANAMHVKQASDLQNSPLFGALLKPGRDHSLFLVVDECDNDDRSEIWRALKGRAAIKLITIDHGPENAGGDGMRTLSAPPLETAEIERILVSYIGIGIGLSKWAEWCGGSARVAHAIGANLKSHPRDILRPPDTVPIWQRFISGYGRESEDGRARTVLRHIALFEKFGHRKPVGHESQHIATLVSKVAPEITRGRFDEIITYYRQRKILQGDRTLRIVPTALRIFLWRDWWESYGDGADVAEMLKDMPDSLHGWFIRPFACAHNLPSAENAVKELLNPRAGLLAEDNFLSTERGSRFVLTLAEADPVSTLALLRTQIHAWPDSMVESLRGERQNLAWALERIAVWEGCFRHAALLLVRLARGDASSNSNNAAGIFKGMFAPIGAATQMPFEDRVGLLIEMLSSEDGVEKALALAACEMALNTRGYSRSGDVELQGMRPRIDCWHPRLWEELIGPWRSLLGTLMASRDGGVANWRSAVDAVLLEGCDNLIRSNVMQTNIVGTMERLALAEHNYEPVLSTIYCWLRYLPAHLPREAAEALATLAKRMEGVTFAERLRRRVLHMFACDESDADEVSVGKTDAEKERQDLAIEAVAGGGERLLDALPNLFGSESYYADKFGESVGRLAHDGGLDQAILARCDEPSGSCRFLSGYLRGVFLSDRARWEGLANALLDAPKRWTMFSVVGSGVTERVFDRVLVLHRDGQVPDECLLDYARESTRAELGARGIGRVVDSLLQVGKVGSRFLALEMAERGLCHGEENMEDEGLVFETLVASAGSGEHMAAMVDHHWGRLAKRFRSKFPLRDIDLLRALLEGPADLSWFSAGGSVSAVAGDICHAHPRQAWPIVAVGLLTERGLTLRAWLSNAGSLARPAPQPFGAFHENDVFDWIDQAPAKRALTVAELLPKTLHGDGPGRLTRNFIERYTDFPHVSEAVMHRFGEGVFTGSASDRLKGQREDARRWQGEGLGGKVLDWLNGYVVSLNDQLDYILVWEERYF